MEALREEGEEDLELTGIINEGNNPANAIPNVNNGLQ